MERMTAGSGIIATQAWVARRISQATWEVRRGARAFSRRYGMWGWCLLGCFVVGALTRIVERHQTAAATALYAQLAERSAEEMRAPWPVTQVQNGDDAGGSDGRARLKAFENHLLPHENIPFAVEDLLRLGEKEGLLMQRGEYRLLIDPAGGFIRYRMTLPVKGAAPAIWRFMQSALRKQKTLALESVQFKRERVESSDVEARIQWVVLTRLPARGADAVRSLTPLSADTGGGQ
jgi:hypothetical protein